MKRCCWCLRLVINIMINREPPIESHAEAQDLSAVQPFSRDQYRVTTMEDNLSALRPNFCEESERASSDVK